MRAAILLALTLVTATSASPQRPDQAQPQGLPLVPGARVRVTAQGMVAPLVANYLELRGDTLVVFEEGSARGIWSFALDDIGRLETTLGERPFHRPYILRGTAIGSALGAAAGIVFAAVAKPPDPTTRYDRLLSAAAGAAGGGAIGALVGSRFKAESWRTVPLPQHSTQSERARATGSGR